MYICIYIYIYLFIIGLVIAQGKISSPPFEWKKCSLLQYLASQTNSGQSKKQ